MLLTLLGSAMVVMAVPVSAAAAPGVSGTPGASQMQLAEGQIPRLDPAFNVAEVAPGFVATLTFTVTNTEELVAQPGWAFTNQLPAGLTVAGRPNFVTTCTDGAITAGNAAGESTVGFTGDLTSGQESCTVSIDVATPLDAQVGDSFTNDVDNVSDLVGLAAPDAATLSIRELARPQVSCTPEDLRATQRWWYFGDAAGLDFDVAGSAAPVAASGAGSSSEGTTVVTDTSGELLFWANGTTVYNRDQAAMPNGTELTGNISATQTVAAFPALGYPGRYFLVTTSGAEASNGQLRYSIIDMTLDNGLGDVTTTKNVDLGAPATAAEGLTAVPNAEGTGFWVISSQNSSPNVRAYLFDSEGPADPDAAGPLAAGDPVITAMPTPNMNQYSAFNLSPDLSQLVMTTNPQGANAGSASRIRLLDFDAATGQLVQRMEWSGATGVGTGNSLYVADFSPSGRYLYATKIFGGGKVYRYTLAGAVDAAAVKASEVEIGALGNYGGQVRRGPDGRMYAVSRGDHALSVIGAPDAPDAADVDFVLHGMSTPGTAARYGLPQMVTGCPLPLVQFEKTVAPTEAVVGDTVIFTFTVTNNTGTDLEALSIDDPMIPVADIDCAATVVTAGDSVACTASYVVDAADVHDDKVVNTAGMSVVPLGGDPATDAIVKTDTAVLGVVPVPSLAIVKEADLTTDNGTVGVADVDDVITYTFTVTNDGDVPLSDVSVNDALPGLSPVLPAEVAALAPNDAAEFTATYTVTQADVDGGDPIVNTATASGTGPGGGTVTSPPNGSNTGVVPPAPGLSIDKRSSLADSNTNGVADVGELVGYTFEVINTGNVTIGDVTVTDPRVTGITPSSVTLAPGARQVFTADPYRVTQADVDWGSVVNVASVGGTGPGGGEVIEEDADEIDTVDPVARIAVQKTGELSVDDAVRGKADVGDVIDYTFTVTNNGTGTARDVSINDELPGLSPVSPTSAATLAPGESVVFTARYTTVKADLTRGSIDNVATASYVPPSPAGGPASAPETTGPSNKVTIVTGPTRPQLSTRASARSATLRIGQDGRTKPVRLSDTVRIRGFIAGGTSKGRATLYGPAAKRSASICTPENRVKTVSFKPRNGRIRTPKVKVTEPGHYTWVVSISADERNLAASHACGLKSESTLVHRPGYGSVVIDTGAAPMSWFARVLNPASVAIPALGLEAEVQTVGRSGRTMRIPDDVQRAGWLMNSAAPGEKVGSAVIAGHVSDNRDRPGQFGKLNKSRPGQVVSVTGSDGRVHRYRITRTFTQSRSKRLARSLFKTKGAHRLVLVTCTGKVSYPGGRFHYTRNRVAVAKPIRS